MPSRAATASIPTATPACYGKARPDGGLPLHHRTPPTARRAPACCTTPRGDIRTPAFMPVGTAGTVKALTVDQVRGDRRRHPAGQHLPPDAAARRAERVARLGGLHRFMRWERPILTDCGGFQVMSLSKISKVTEEAVTFQSHIDGSRHVLTPGALDRDPGRPAGLRHRHAAGRAASRCRPTEDAGAPTPCAARPAGAQRSQGRVRRRARPRRCSASSRARPSEALRRESAERLTEIGFDGYAIGGLAVGEGHAGDVRGAGLRARPCCRPTGRAT